MCDVDADKPFICSKPGCGMRFTNEDHLNVHRQKHELSLDVHSGCSSTAAEPHVPEQTPTPTKFLKNYEEISLFHELSNNPFEDAFQKASDADGLPPIPPGAQSTELNTPVLPPLSGDHHQLLLGSTAAFSSYDGRVAQPPTSLNTRNASLLPGRGFALDLCGQTTVTERVGMERTVVMLPSSSTTIITTSSMTSSSSSSSSSSREQHEEEGEGGQMSCDVGADGALSSPSKHMLSLSSSLSSVIPVVSATEVMLGHALSGNVTDSEQDMTSALAAVPQSSAGTPQVYLQLPTGHTVPVHIPASVSSTMQEVPASTQYQPPHQAVAMLPTQTQTVEVGSYHAKSPTALQSPGGTCVALKQRLKQTLQAQVQTPDPASPTSGQGEMGEQSPNLHTPNSDSTQVLLNSPTSNFNLADLEPVSKRPKNGSIDTDDPEERREKFLERNRAAAARCRHKRKQWIVNLEKKADELQQTNSKLQGEVGLLKGEVAQLKTLLLAHQNCPISMYQHSPHTISVVESSSSIPLDIGQLVSPSSSTILTPVDSQEISALDPAAFAVSAAADQ